MNYSIPEISVICENLAYKYNIGQLDSFEIEKERVVLIGGAGIINEGFIKTHTVINAHPGFIPDCRGLDSFKWAIAEDKPIGVTTHLLGDYVDAGLVIERRMINLLSTDSFHALAQRVYENEVSMLVEAIEKKDETELQLIKPGESTLHKRMPKEIEKNLMDLFEKYKEKHAIE